MLLAWCALGFARRLCSGIGFRNVLLRDYWSVHRVWVGGLSNLIFVLLQDLSPVAKIEIEPYTPFTKAA